MECSRLAISNLAQQHNCTKFGEMEGHEIWITPHKHIIQIPLTRLVHYDIIEEIAINILGMNAWDFDYWLGQNSVN